MVARMVSLLANVMQLAPRAEVFLASVMFGMSLLPPADISRARRVAFNAQLPRGMVKEWGSKGLDITYVPMYEQSGVCVGPLSPGWSHIDHELEDLCCAAHVHPTAAVRLRLLPLGRCCCLKMGAGQGYLRMASAFALVIAEKHKTVRKAAHKEPPMKLDDVVPQEQQLPVQRHVGQWSKP
jgi:hypothetical protein